MKKKLGNSLILETNDLTFKKGEEYLDVKWHIEGWLELKIETSDSFTIESEEEIDIICRKLKEMINQSKQ